MNRSTPPTPCPSPTPRVYPNSCPVSQWCHPTISSSVIPFSSFPQSFPASESFQMSQLFTSGGQSIGVSASASVLPMNTQDWSPLEWTGWISLQSKGLSRVFSNTTVQKHQFCQCGRCKRRGINPWVGKMPWRREWQPTSVFLPRKFVDRGAWWAAIHGAAKTQTKLSMSMMHCTPTGDRYLLHRFIWIKPGVVTCKEKIG